MYVKIPSTKLILPDQDCVFINQSGNVMIDNNITLTDVMYAPNFKYNILSVSFLTQKIPVSVTFNSQLFLYRTMPARG